VGWFNFWLAWLADNAACASKGRCDDFADRRLVVAEVSSGPSIIDISVPKDVVKPGVKGKPPSPWACSGLETSECLASNVSESSMGCARSGTWLVLRCMKWLTESLSPGSFEESAILSRSSDAAILTGVVVGATAAAVDSLLEVMPGRDDSNALAVVGVK
jgi:hypothetical protein